MHVNLFTPGLPTMRFENKMGIASTALFKEAAKCGLKLTDNNCFHDEAFPEDCVMSAMDDNQLMLPGSNLGGHQSFGAINVQIAQINQQDLAEFTRPSEFSLQTLGKNLISDFQPTDHF